MAKYIKPVTRIISFNHTNLLVGSVVYPENKTCNSNCIPGRPLREACELLIPELAESEDERIRKAIEDVIRVYGKTQGSYIGGYDMDTLVFYLREAFSSLKKQKESVEELTTRLNGAMQEGRQVGQNEGVKLVLNNPEKYGLQKEQKPRKFKLGDKVHWHDDNMNVITIIGFRDDAYLTDSAYGPILFCDEDNWERIEQKPVEWSEEDEKMRMTAIEACKTVAEDYENSNSRFLKCKAWLESLPVGFIINPQYNSDMVELLVSELQAIAKNNGTLKQYDAEITWLKSLRPQPIKEIYQAAKHDLAIKFMNYLDENRPEGKMCLSNGECEDINKAFKENDWAKIMRYMEKYRPSWKPREEQM